MRTLTFKVLETLGGRIEEAARKRAESKSALVRRAVERLLARESPLPGSFAELAADFAGSVEGPGDLSTNPRRMKGYGR